MNKQEKPNYMDLMDVFFTNTEKITENSTNTQIVEVLQESKALIEEIATLTKGTPLFIKAQDQYEDFKTDMFQKREGEEQIIFAYTQLIGKIAVAPTFLHMRSSIVLLMPLLADSLKLGKF